ncbi:PQQ-binding-like beta-propeller repeat protein [Natronoarchaeum philippinense]|uniref:PQQ-binding-like beta-propeller repeat protein n=1 Tax=Natronoarchaeum philippinense TaxID=558529 RepID=UPI0015CBCF9F|nr:PQQ-binding-like beta-propeller repeat protein [Natronoarchaeum philippinense]
MPAYTTRRSVLSLIAGATVTGTASAAQRAKERRVDATTQSASVDRVASDEYDAVSLVTDVSASGDRVLFGFENGDLVSYGANRQATPIPFDVGSTLSHIEFERAADTAAVAWMDAEVYGQLTLATRDGPVIEHPGLWDLAVAAADGAIASVSSPIEGPGSVMLSTEAGQSWVVDVENAAGGSVDISAAGKFIAVGATQYLGTGEALAGQPGVVLYDGSGAQQWAHETGVDVIAVQIDAEAERVVAGTYDGRLLALDLAGNLVWEDELLVTWPRISSDGSTVVSTGSDGVVRAYDPVTGDERWTTETGASLGNDTSVTDDGTRVLAAARTEGEIFVVEESGVVWERAYGIGPAIGEIAADGRTWSVGIQNSDAQTGRVEIYRQSESVAPETL